MTFLEKLEREHPEFIGEKFPGGVAICPEDCGYEKSTPCGAMTENGTFDPTACMACWNREVPEKTDCHTNAAAMARNDEEGGGGHG